VFVVAKLAASSPIALLCLVIGFAGALVSSSILFFLVEKRFSLVQNKKQTAVVEPS
jgi:hypothetical protein